MQGGPTPDGEPRPPNPPEITCISNDALNPLEPNVYDAANAQSIDTPSSKYSKKSGRRAASFLLLAHIIEVTVMVVSTFLRVVPHSLKFPSFSSSPSSTPSDSSAEFSPFLLGIHLGFILVPFTVLTAVSLVWVLRVQDFSGRFVARLVCWILHLFQSSLIWRYLKVQMAYDPGDLAEFGMLRFIQIHIHTLPFLVMHIATTLSVSRSLGFVLCITLGLIVSTAITIILSSTVHKKSQPSALSLPIITQMCHMSTLTKNKGILKKNSRSFKIAVTVTTVCILWSRIIALATLFCVHAVWAIILIILHWVVAAVWLGFHQESPSPSSPTNANRQIVRRLFLAYLLLWDWHSFSEDSFSETVCSKPKLPAVYYTFISVENISATSLWYATRHLSDNPALWTFVLASVVIAQIIGLALLALSYLYSSSLLLRLPFNSSSLTKSRKPSLVTQTCKPSSDIGAKMEDTVDVVPSIESPSFSGYTDLPEVISTIVKEVKISKDRENQDSCSPKNSTKRKDKDNHINYPLQLSPRLLSKNFSSSMFSYSQDILQHANKSERSSTENGSFNSRNTNTLPQSTIMAPDYEITHQPHGSFSDSFSSLSCGTVNKAITITPKNILYNQISAHNVRRIKHLKLSKKDSQDKMINHLSQTCSEVEEESTTSRLPLDENIDEFRSLSSLEKSSLAPKATILTATQRFQVVCTKCLEAHDPLLTKCRIECRMSGPPSLSYSCGGELGVIGGGSSTDYPSDTEITTTIDSLSTFSAESHSTYTTWPVGRGPGLAKLLMREKGGHDYVTAWLRHQQSRGGIEISPPMISLKNELHRPSRNSNQVKAGHSGAGKFTRTTRRHGHKVRLRSPPAFVQDLETIV